jgi:heme/copper-type cytochrome/quinol oxidase subunit 4
MSIYLPNKNEIEEHLPSTLDYQNNEAIISSLLTKRSQTIKDFLDVSSSGTNDYSDATNVTAQLADIDSNIEATWGTINSNIQDIYATKGMHNQTLVNNKNKLLDNVIKRSGVQSRDLQKIQRDIGAINGEKDDSDLSVKTYNFQYYVFIILTLIIIITTIVSLVKSETSIYEWVILAFFCLIIVLRFFSYLKENVPIWWSNFLNGVEKIT